MRFIAFLTFATVSLLSISYWYTATAHICPAPILYRIGEVDERFAVPVKVVADTARLAESVWEDATNRDLFRFDETASFTINLIYDERQQLANTEEEWRIALDQKQTEYEQLVEELQVIGTRYQSLEASYEEERAEYEAALAAYNAEVAEYNEAGGAPPDEYARLQREAGRLNNLLEVLLETEVAIKNQAAIINELGDRGNALIAAYNAEVEEYNAVFGNLTTFTQGDYERKRINIYKFTDTEELTRVLVHEFGHALGIGHVEGEDSAMYYLMTERDPTLLQAADVAAFEAVCSSTSRWSDHVRRQIRTVLNAINQI